MSLIAEALIITRRSQEIATCRPTLSEPLSQQDVRCLGVAVLLVARLTSQPCAVRGSRAAIDNEAGRSMLEGRSTV
jgi:hypothetical protein